MHYRQVVLVPRRSPRAPHQIQLFRLRQRLLGGVGPSPKGKPPIYNRYIVFHQPTGRQGVFVVGQTGFTDSIVWAKSEAHLAAQKVQYEVPADPPAITLPQTSLFTEQHAGEAVDSL